MFMGLCYRGPDRHCLSLFCIYNFFHNKKSLVPDAHVHIQRLVSRVKMATMLKGCPTEEQRSVVGFLWAKELNAKDIHEEIFPIYGWKYL
jgi:hypothetical protein